LDLAPPRSSFAAGQQGLFVFVEVRLVDYSPDGTGTKSINYTCLGALLSFSLSCFAISLGFICISAFYISEVATSSLLSPQFSCSFAFDLIYISVFAESYSYTNVAFPCAYVQKPGTCIITAGWHLPYCSSLPLDLPFSSHPWPRIHYNFTTSTHILATYIL